MYLDAVEVEKERLYLRSATVRQFHELGTAFDGHV